MKMTQRTRTLPRKSERGAPRPITAEGLHRVRGGTEPTGTGKTLSAHLLGKST